jgi:CoA:oxalate CoA-transferase
LRQRGTVRAVSDPLLGAFDIPGMPVRFSSWTPPAELAADVLGQHNDEILRDIAGLSQAEIDTLHAQHVLVRDTTPKKAAG